MNTSIKSMYLFKQNDKLLYKDIIKEINNAIYKYDIETVILPTSNSILSNDIVKTIIDDIKCNITILEEVTRNKTPKEILEFIKSEYGDDSIYNYCKANNLNYIDISRKACISISSIIDEKYSAHKFDDINVRGAISNAVSIIVPDYPNIDECNNSINGKNVIVIDDSINEGNALEDTLNVILNDYTPNSLIELILSSVEIKPIIKPHKFNNQIRNEL